MSNLLLFCVCPSDPNFRKTFMGMVFPRFQEPSMYAIWVMVNNWGSGGFRGGLYKGVIFLLPKQKFFDILGFPFGQELSNTNFTTNLQPKEFRFCVKTRFFRMCRARFFPIFQSNFSL